ncbi:MAG: glycosyl transferase [Verrucomicrobia bacterium]|jgi:glucosyl-3-phosphoglycerate synthase|nr:MAG: glycosyl transferase [Verrucomicrobiota bacterium]
MSDFAQTGLICTLQRLNDGHLAKIERDLAGLATEQGIALVLPCHGGDLERPALAHIVAELAEGPRFLREIVVSMNGVTAEQFERAEGRFAALPMRRTFLWNDRPGVAAGIGGKGGNVAAALRHLVGEGTCGIIATQDADVASFRRQDLARLCYAVAEPRLGFEFAKMYYPRVTDRLYGRVSRLFLAPLLQALVRVAGHQPLLGFLLSFRYPLSGEVAMTRETAAALPVAAGWGLEVGQLCEVFRQLDPRRVCQVGGGAGYDHKHQPATTALAGMAAEIAAELFRQLGAEGLPADAAFRRAVAAAYRREAALALHRSASLALINDLPFDENSEREMIAVFAGTLDQ